VDGISGRDFVNGQERTLRTLLLKLNADGKGLDCLSLPAGYSNVKRAISTKSASLVSD
jgi:hypothetical protein